MTKGAKLPASWEGIFFVGGEAKEARRRDGLPMPMMERSLVVTMTSTMRSGVEKACTMPATTSGAGD